MWPMRELVPTKSKPVADIPFLFCILEGWILLSFAHDVFLSLCVFCFVYGKTASHAKKGENSGVKGIKALYYRHLKFMKIKQSEIKHHTE